MWVYDGIMVVVGFPGRNGEIGCKGIEWDKLGKLKRPGIAFYTINFTISVDVRMSYISLIFINIHLYIEASYYNF